MKYLTILLLALATACAPVVNPTPPQPASTPYPVQPTYTPAATYTPLPSSTPYPTPTVFSGGRLQRAHPLPTVDAEGVTIVDFIEYRCFEAYYYGIADGHNFWVHDDADGYRKCIETGHAGIKRGTL